MMDVIQTREDLDRNIAELHSYLASNDPDLAEYARGLIKRGICFVVTDNSGESVFSPSRFVGYSGNTRALHDANRHKDGRITNPAISNVLNTTPEPNEVLDQEYERFCQRIGITPSRRGSYGVTRKFWDAR